MSPMRAEAQNREIGPPKGVISEDQSRTANSGTTLNKATIAGEPRPAAVAFVTTEHFTLQGARSAAISESIGRASMFLASLSGGLVALGLLATATHVGTASYAFGAEVPHCRRNRRRHHGRCCRVRHGPGRRSRLPLLAGCHRCGGISRPCRPDRSDAPSGFGLEGGHESNAF